MYEVMKSDFFPFWNTYSNVEMLKRNFLCTVYLFLMFVYRRNGK